MKYIIVIKTSEEYKNEEMAIKRWKELIENPITKRNKIEIAYFIKEGEIKNEYKKHK